jgi:hypothetical protein
MKFIGSSLVIEKEKFEQKSDGLYLSGRLISQTDLLNNGI